MLFTFCVSLDLDNFYYQMSARSSCRESAAQICIVFLHLLGLFCSLLHITNISVKEKYEVLDILIIHRRSTCQQGLAKTFLFSDQRGGKKMPLQNIDTSKSACSSFLSPSSLWFYFIYGPMISSFTLLIDHSTFSFQFQYFIVSVWNMVIV